MQTEIKKERIEILDGLRVIAIFMVIIFHFYSRFEGIHYSYCFKSPHVLSYGFLGVELFFIISGFVISLTFTKCKNFSEFIKKRFIRLIPGMLICSLLTFIFIALFDSNDIFNNSKSVPNLLVSNTFISPDLINKLLGTNFRYIDGAYWSLWVELQFYIIGGILYFMSPKNFLRNYTSFAIVGEGLYITVVSTSGYHLLGSLLGHEHFLTLRTFCSIFSVLGSNLWFLAGIIVNKLYFGGKDKKLLILLFLIFGMQMALLQNIYAISFTVIVLIIFLLFLYYQQSIRFLANKMLLKIGIASYSIYLIHQNIGVLLINKLAPSFGVFNWIIPIILIISFSMFGVYSYKFLEAPIGKRIKTIVLKKHSFGIDIKKQTAKEIPIE